MTTMPEMGLKSLAISSITAEVAVVQGIQTLTLKKTPVNIFLKIGLLRNMGYHPGVMLFLFCNLRAGLETGPSGFNINFALKMLRI